MPYFRASDAVADVEGDVLVTLDMYDACLYSEGLAQVTAALRFNTACRALYLGRNAIGPEGAAEILVALGHNGNRTLQALYLSGNRSVGRVGGATRERARTRETN